MSSARFLVGDVFEQLADIPDGSVDLIVTSPPFLALRSYLPADHPDKGKEIGSEATPAAFLSTLLALTREWRRVLAPHGSLCVELGDTYSGSGGAGGDYGPGGLRDGQQRFDGSASKAYGTGAAPRPERSRTRRPDVGWPLDKSLSLIPSLYAGSLAYGCNLLNPDDTCDPWRVRNLIVWHRPNPPVGALGDKVRPSTSYVTVACTARDRWFDLDAERTDPKPGTYGVDGNGRDRSGNGFRGITEGSTNQPRTDHHPAGAPPLDCWFDATTDDVWTIPTQPYKGAHYATFPITLPRRLINLMCPRQVCTVCGEPRRRITSVSYEPHGERHEENKGVRGIGVVNGEHAQHMEHGRATKNVETLGWTDCGHNSYRRGVVLDPFAGSGTTLAAASELGRNAIGIDLDERNLDLARQRIGLFLEAAS